jgi:hypothetical protein
MNTTTQTENVTTSNVGATVTAEQLKMQLALIEEARIEKLPDASLEQMAALLELTRSVRCDVTAKDLGLNERFKLDPVQRAMLNVAKAEHEKLINTDKVKDQALECVENGHLTSFKLKMSKAGLTFKITGRAKRR